MSFALGAALHYTHDLSTDPAPLRALWHELVAGLPPASLFQWTGTASKVGKKAAFEPGKLEAAVRSGDAASAAVEAPGHLLVLSHAQAAARLREPLVPRPWRYDTAIALSADRVAALGAERALAAIIAFADAVAVQAGVVYWTESLAYAGALATGGVAGELTPEQERRVRDSHDLSNHWGRIVRGPAWGTFLHATHLARLGELAGLPAAKIVSLRSGGAFVQLTALDEARPVDEASPALDRLRAALAPVLA